MSNTHLYQARKGDLSIDLFKTPAGGYLIRVAASGGTQEQTIPTYHAASELYHDLCKFAQVSPQLMDKPERTAAVILAEMRAMLASQPQRSREILRTYANDPEMQENRAQIRQLATQTNLNDSLIRSMCTQLDKEIREREKVLEQQTYVENDLYGAF